MPAPSIGVGGGGKGGNLQQPAKENGSGGKSLSDEVGEMAEQSREGKGHTEPPQDAGSGTVLRERRTEEPPNPKKRTWEEPSSPPASEQQERIRDEL